MGFPNTGTATYQNVSPADEGQIKFWHRGEPSTALRPLVVYVHGGGWRQGDLTQVGVKDDLAFDNGANFCSVGYRLSPYAQSSRPKSTWSASRFKREHVLDVAKAIAAIQANCLNYGCDPDRLILIGHSAGAHLVALLCAKVSLLTDAGADPAGILGGVVLDTAFYDLLQRYDATDPLVPNAFGIVPDKHPGASWRFLDYATQAKAEATLAEYSPGSHISSASRPIMVATRGTSSGRTISQTYFDAYSAVVPDCFFHDYPGSTAYDHNEINQCIGKPASQDPPAGNSLPSGEVRITSAVLSAIGTWLA